MLDGLVELISPGRRHRECSEELGPQAGEGECVPLAGAPAMKAPFPQPKPARVSALPVSVETFKIEKLCPAASEFLVGWFLPRQLLFGEQELDGRKLAWGEPVKGARKPRG
jgi:hypothetical protein